MIGEISVFQLGMIGIAGLTLGTAVIALSELPARWLPLVLVAAGIPCLAMILGDLERLFLGAVLLDIPLQLDVNLGYRPEAAALGAVGGLNVSITTVALIGLYALWLIRIVRGSTSSEQKSHHISLPMIAYVMIVAATLTISRDLTLSLYGFNILIHMILLYIYVSNNIRTHEDVRFIMSLLLIGMALEACFMIILASVGQEVRLAGIVGRVDVSRSTLGASSRIAGTAGSPNDTAAYVNLVLAPALCVLWTPLTRLHKMLALSASMVGVIALLLTLSRGAWISLGLALAIIGLGAWRRGWIRTPAVLSAAAAVGAVALAAQGTLATRLMSDDGGSAHSRVPLMDLAFRMIQDHPWLGIGLNNFAVAISDYATPDFGGEWLYTVHNVYLRIWAETGPGALLAFVTFLVMTMLSAWRCWRSSDPVISPLALGFMAGLAGFVLHMNVDVFNGRLPDQLFWLIAGLIAAMTVIQRAARDAWTSTPHAPSADPQSAPSVVGPTARFSINRGLA